MVLETVGDGLLVLGQMCNSMNLHLFDFVWIMRRLFWEINGMCVDASWPESSLSK